MPDFPGGYWFESHNVSHFVPFEVHSWSKLTFMHDIF